MSEYPPVPPVPPQRPNDPRVPPPSVPVTPPYPGQGYPQGYPQGQGGYAQPQGSFGTGGYSLPGQQSNGLAITSLVMGILGFCVPFVGGALAILFALLGFGRAKKTRSGTGMALAGLILGILSLGMYVLFSASIWAIFAGTQHHRDLANTFIRDLASGNVTGAAAKADASGLPQSELDELSTTLKGEGTVKDVTSFSTSVVNNEATLVGLITFSNDARRGFQMKQRKSGEEWKVVSFELDTSAASDGGTTGGSTPGSTTRPARTTSP